MKKIFFFSLAALFISASMYAQNIDQVKLKSGSIIRGDIEKIVPDGEVTINDLSGNTWVFKMSEVESIEEVKQDREVVKVRNENYNTSIGYQAGFKNMTSIGFLAGSQSSEHPAPFSMLTSFGYLSNMGIYAGLTTGLEFINVIHVPMMLDVNYFFNDRDVCPVAIFRVGYTLPTKNMSQVYNTEYNYSGGISGALGMGLKIRSKDNFAWDISLLYRYMEVNYTEKYDWQDYTNTYKDVYNRLEVRIGVYLDL